MTRNEFIELLTTEWDENVPHLMSMSSMQLQLPRLCMHLATDAFVKDRSGPAIDELRVQLLHLEETGSFKLDGY